jgi:hypothetical protein
MADIPEVKISDAELIKVMPDRELTSPEAKKIIADTKKVLIEGVEAKEKGRSSTSISVEAPSNLSEKSWSVILLSRDAEEEDQIIAILDYDPVTKQFHAPDDEEDEDEEGGPP